MKCKKRCVFETAEKEDVTVDVHIGYVGRNNIYIYIYIYIHTRFQKGFHTERYLDRYIYFCSLAREPVCIFSLVIVQLVKNSVQPLRACLHGVGDPGLVG